MGRARRKLDADARAWRRQQRDPARAAREQAWQQARAARDQERARLRKLSAAIAAWHRDTKPANVLPSPLALLAAEVGRLNAELEVATRRTVEAQVAGERDGYRRGFVAGKRSGAM